MNLSGQILSAFRSFKSINSISVKLFIATSALVALTSFFLSLQFISYSKNTLLSNEMYFTDSISKNLASNAEYAVLTLNTALLNSLVADAEGERNIIYVSILDKNDKELASHGKVTESSYTSESTITAKATDNSQDKIQEILLMPSQDTEKNEIIGKVVVVSSLKQVYQIINNYKKRAIFVTLIVILIGMAFTYVIVNKLTSPINELVLATEKISSGELNFKVSKRTNDEIGKLANAFNIMTESLQKTTVSKDYVNSIIESIDDSVIVIDDQYSMTKLNESTLKLLHFSSDELIGKPLKLLCEDCANIIEWGRIISDNKSYHYELNYHAKNGEIIPMEVSIAMVKNVYLSSISKFVIVARDMRELKALRRTVAQSEKMASIGRIAGGIAHEINNPMSVILGFAQTIMLNIKEVDNLYLPLKSIEREAIRCKHLISDLLTFSRTSKSTLELSDFNSVIEGALTLIEAQSKIGNIDIIRNYFTDLPKISINKNRIQQVIINLCNNAIDALPQGGKITISTSLNQDKTSVDLVVADTGTGIPSEIKDKIFEPFFTTKEVGEGTGLGLSLCYEILMQHNATVTVRSELNKGTEFDIRFPLTLKQ